MPFALQQQRPETSPGIGVGMDHATVEQLVRQGLPLKPEPLSPPHRLPLKPERRPAWCHATASWLASSDL